MTPGVPGDAFELGEDGLMVLVVNGLTGYAKGWLEDVLPDSFLPHARRLYVLLPVACAAVLCFILDPGDSWERLLMCGIKYGTLASYVKVGHRSGWEGR